MFTSALLHAPTQCCCGFFGSSCSLSSSSSKSKKLRRNNRFSMSTSTRIVVVGDVHDDWNLQEDTKALQLLKPDLVLFTGRSSYPYVIFPPDVVGNHTFGDFGNENVALVRTIADLKMAKAVILGNHDAWGTQKFSQRDKDSVQLQLECLGEEHVGYRRLDFPLLKLSIVGGRPFSCGGQQLFRKKLLSARYGVHNMEGSANRICEAALGTPEDHSVIILAHNGPTGLGSNADDICGRDWVYEAGDHGDPDLARAISRLKENSELSLPLVVFGHMHKELALRKGLRKMIAVGANNTVYLNGAIVPRVKRLAHEQGTNSENATDNVNPGLTPRLECTMRAFTLVEILGGKLEKITETWVSVIGEETTLEEEHTLFSSRN